jgi:TRAP-type C4-dicarboxylate transport system permease small subunit
VIGLERALLRLRPAAEAVQVLMMLAMFVAFILQVVFRYVVNLPLAWTEEVCTLAWIWGVTWGASFVMRNSDDMRFDLVITVLSPGLRRWLACFSSFALVLIFGISIPATWSYISFMKVESSASLGIPLNLVFACYMLFVLALMVRHALIGVHALRGDPDDLTGLPS